MCSSRDQAKFRPRQGITIATKAQLVFHWKSFFKYMLLRNVNYHIMEKKNLRKDHLISFHLKEYHC